MESEGAIVGLHWSCITLKENTGRKQKKNSRKVTHDCKDCFEFQTGKSESGRIPKEERK